MRTSVVLLLAALVLALGGATAQGAEVKAKQVGKSASAVREYWTAERMANAKPADLVRNADGSVERKRAAAAVPWTSHEAPQPYNPMHGKVFFSEGGQNFVCSGTALTSSNQSTVWTAGHCVNNGAGTFHTNWSFVPAYRNGSRPYGTWTARNLWTTSGWHNGGDFGVDLGAAAVNTSGGSTLTSVTGGRGITFNYARQQAYQSWGYPAAPPFTGGLSWICDSEWATDDTSSSPATIGIGCDMTGGSSGGGWIVGNSVASVNSYGYTNQPNVMYGPYQSSAAQSLYNAASTG
jgi:hypothetical protein